LGSLPLPPFGTFYGEWGLIHVIVSLLQGAALQPGLLPILILFLSAIGLIGGLALFAMIKLFAISMLGQPRSTHHAIKPEKGDNFLIIPIGILAAAVAAVGLFAQPLVARLNYFLDSGNGPSGVVGGQLSSYALFIFALAALLFAYLFNLVFARNKTERPYHTWDCGQPINATMEYTSTAFVAPIRFFFINLIRRTRVLASEPVVSTNAWIRKYSYAISIHPAMKETLYRPVSKLVFAWAERAKVVQSGRIQYYILLLLVTLIIALSIAL
ncbi:hypothetical protein HGA64_04490, partial [Candidatus Falkowbacteria bacterium]|nr:hypothetical protein [Candidatus Falkowbacteria bacterium]